MLAIRMQRTGRKGHAMFRVIVQESRLTPTSGKVVAGLGSYDPHGKTVTLDKEKASYYLNNGAQPSERVARLLKAEGVKLPDWVKLPADQKRETRNPDKRRSTAPEQPKAEEPETPAEEPAVEEPEVPAEEPAAEESPAESQETPEPAAEPAPAEEPPAEEPADTAPDPAVEEQSAENPS
jgi:small subunit ribosomal protein S16